MRADS
jgi:hypothetical protein